MIIKALSLWQPHASLMACDEGTRKRFETRSWGPTEEQLAPGELLAIHAAKPLDGVREVIGDTTDRGRMIREAIQTLGYATWGDLPLGAVVCITRYLGYRYTGTTRQPAPWVAELSEQERAFGGYSPNRYAWETDLVLRLPEPLPARGYQGIWQWEVPMPELVPARGHQGIWHWEVPANNVESLLAEVERGTP